MSEGPTASATPPKVFVSYRWTSPEHEEWVLRFATSLRGHGIDTQLDKWHLKEGQDTLAFMESMISDPSIKKVLMICDSGYVERADSREGGVGTEAQIISAAVYEKTEQSKFAAVVRELDEAGKPLLPIYMKTRLYFDMSSLDAQAQNFEHIVRWIFDEPFHIAPPIGEKPEFSGKTYVTGSSLFKIPSSGQASFTTSANESLADSILASIVEESQSFHLDLVDKPAAAEDVVRTIANFRSVSENAYRAIRNLILSDHASKADILHNVFDTLFRTWDLTPINKNYSRWDNDAYQYFSHDLLVSFVAISMDLRQFELAQDVLSLPFFKPRPHDATGQASEYVEFRPYLESLESIGRQKNRLSLHADLLNEGHENSTVSRIAFMEADLTLHLRGIMSPKLKWYPISALYLSGTYGALPSFVRAKSTRFYDRLKPLLLGSEADSIRTALADLSSNNNGLKFDYRTLDVARLIAASELATSP